MTVAYRSPVCQPLIYNHPYPACQWPAVAHVLPASHLSVGGVYGIPGPPKVPLIAAEPIYQALVLAQLLLVQLVKNFDIVTKLSLLIIIIICIHIYLST